ncbi:MAG: GAF domain-containing protein [Chloroflexi bacterium]|nr:GAF domain-containing protein [Chloroflexota bacterium]
MSEQDKSTTQNQIALWAAGVFAAMGVVLFGYSIYNVVVFQQGRFDLSDQILMPITAMMVIVSIISYGLIQRGRHALGTWLLFLMGTLVPPIMAVLLLKGLIYIAIVYIVSLAMIMIRLVLPNNGRRTAMVAASVVILLMIGIEAWNPAFRLNTGIGNFTTTITVLAVIGLLAFIARQSVTGNIRTKIMVTIIGITLLTMVVFGIVANQITRTQIIKDSGTILQSGADSQAELVGSFLARHLEYLTLIRPQFEGLASSSNVSYTGDEAAIKSKIEQLDQTWVAADQADNDADPLVFSKINNFTAFQLRTYRDTYPENVELFVTDKYGAVIAATNRTSDYNQSDETWWQTAYNNGVGANYIGSIEYDESAKVYSINMAVPIYASGTTRVIGVLRTTVTMQSLLDAFSTNQTEGTSVEVLFPDGQILRNGKLDTSSAAEQSQLRATTRPYSEFMYEGAQSFVSTAVIQSSNETVHGQDWLIVLHEDSQYALAPADTQLRAILLTGLILAALVAMIGFFFARNLTAPILQLTNTAKKLASGDFNVEAKITTQDEVGQLAITFNNMASQIRGFVETLEQRVAERTQSLELASEVGRAVSQVRSLDVMLTEATELIRSRFDLYYVQVYLTNPSGTALLLRSGTGSVGQQLLARAHQLPLNTSSINGRAATEKHPVVISNTADSSTFRPNPLLPETRSEMSVPLMIGEKVVGVLDLQSQKADALNEDLLSAFEALAGQLAIAIQNATFLAETERAHAEVEAQARRQSRTNWNEYMDAIHRPEETGFVFEQNKIALIGTQEVSPTENALTAPISVIGEALGNLVVEMQGQSSIALGSDLVHAVARQVSQQIESLRLLDSAERYRFEAEEASRRLTREGWKIYKQANINEGLSYFYDLNEVRPYDQNGTQPNEGSMSLPLIVRDEVVGKLVVEGLGSDDAESLELANTVAERLSAHIESLRQFEETKRGQIELDKRARQLAAVAEVSSVSSRELDIDKMLHSVVHLTQRKFGLYHAHIFIFNENTRELKIAACGYKEGDIHEGTDGTAVIPLEKEQSLVARAARTGQPVIVNDVHHEAGWLPNPLLPETQSEMAVALFIGDQLLGVLDVQSEHLNAFSDEDASIYETLASQVSTALQNARSFERAQQQAQRESTLNLISQKIQSATTVEAVLQIAARELGHALGAPMTIAQLSMKDKK